MAFLMDFHLHTNRYSRDSAILPKDLIPKAIARGLHGVVITEHHWQWTQDECRQLLNEAGNPVFTLLAGFEYSSCKGDILIYGLPDGAFREFLPGGDPEIMLKKALDLGAACIAAHPTRRAIPFDNRIYHMPFHAIEVQSSNLDESEQERGNQLAEFLKRPATACSDAHRTEDIGLYATVFPLPIRTMPDFVRAIQSGAFRPAVNADRPRPLKFQ